MARFQTTEIVSVAAGMLIAAGLAFLFFRDAGSGNFYPPSERRQISRLSLPRLDGTTWRLSDQKGKVVLLNFWATWCPPCRRETPALVELSTRYLAAGLVVAGIAMDEGAPDNVRRFVTDHHIPYAILLPSEGSRLNLSSTLQGLPTSVLLDRQLRIAKIYVGAISLATFSRDVASLLKEPAGGVRAVPARDEKRMPPQSRMM